MRSHSKAPRTARPIPPISPRRPLSKRTAAHQRMESTIRLSSELKHLRHGRGVTLRELSELTGVSNSYLSQLENGRFREPSMHALAKLSEFYGISYQRFVKVLGYVDVGSNDVRAERHIDGLRDLNSDDIEYVRDFVDFLRFKQARNFSGRNYVVKSGKRTSQTGRTTSRSAKVSETVSERG